jgi:integrase
MVAFFATVYFAGLRPGEVLALREHDLELPERGWGELRFEESSPYSGPAWTDSGIAAPRKALKHRNQGECRIVPAHPELVRHLRRHLDTIGTYADGRLFVNATGKPLTYGSYSIVWKRARRAALTEVQFNSPLAARPYDLRHAAVSTWLNAGVPATQVAEWAGHSVEILLSTYAKCVDGQEAQARDRIAEALGRIDEEQPPTAPDQ